jgi:Raf kinase inhibitor-like YbhB/YbcL family protein
MITLLVPIALALSTVPHQGATTMQLTSPAFQPGGQIPRENTCDGADTSPALSWTGAPENTKSFALICDDPDAPRGTWVHWVMFNLAPQTHELPAGVSSDRAPGGAVQGRNDFKNQGYGSPCPPPGKPHRYFFKLYALDTDLNLRAGATKSDVESAIKGHILADAQLMGAYGR